MQVPELVLGLLVAVVAFATLAPTPRMPAPRAAPGLDN